MAYRYSEGHGLTSNELRVVRPGRVFVAGCIRTIEISQHAMWSDISL